jgi:hypothetical protein
MSDDNNTQRTMGQSIGYWAIIYAIAIPALFIGTAIVVRMALMSAA